MREGVGGGRAGVEGEGEGQGLRRTVPKSELHTGHVGRRRHRARSLEEGEHVDVNVECCGGGGGRLCQMKRMGVARGEPIAYAARGEERDGGERRCTRAMAF